MGISYNKVTLLGNVAQDPETRYTQSGKAVTKFALAVNSPKSKEAPRRTSIRYLAAVTYSLPA